MSDGFVRSLNVPILIGSFGGEGVRGFGFGGEGCSEGEEGWGIRSVRLSTNGFIVVQSVKNVAVCSSSLPSLLDEGGGNGEGGGSGICSGIRSSALHLFTINGTLLKSSSPQYLFS